MPTAAQRQNVKRVILEYFKRSGIRGLVNDISHGDLNHRYANLTDKFSGNCWLVVELKTVRGSRSGKGVCLQLYSRDPSCMNDLRYSRYCNVHPGATQKIKFIQEDPIRRHSQTREMGHLEHEDMDWENLTSKDMVDLLADCRLLLKTANKVLGEFPNSF